MDKRMLINAVETEECRIAILENNVLEELYIEKEFSGTDCRKYLQRKGCER